MIVRTFVEVSFRPLCTLLLLASSCDAFAISDAAGALLDPNTSFLPSLYSAPALEAWIVDADTKQPVEGVVVAASWQSETHTYGGRYPGEVIHIMEAITDAKGHFSIPGWGPVLVKRGHVEEESPKLIVFMPGYEFLTLWSETGGPSGTNYRAAWNKTRIDIKRSEKATLKQLERLTSELRYVIEKPEECRWRLLPKMILTIRQSRLELKAIGQTPFAWQTLDERIASNADFFAKAGGPQCGNPKQLLEKETR